MSAASVWVFQSHRETNFNPWKNTTYKIMLYYYLMSDDEGQLLTSIIGPFLVMLIVFIDKIRGGDE